MLRRTFIAAACLGFTGCTAFSPFALIAPAIEGYIYWRDGEARKYYKRTPEDVFSAVKLTALNDLQHEAISEMRIDGGYDLITHSKNHKFHIRVMPTDPLIAVCKIRVDFMGDKPYAELLYRTMDKYLGSQTVGVVEETSDGRRILRR